MNIYVAQIRLEDGIVTMPQRTRWAEAQADCRKLKERYKDVAISVAWIETYTY